MASFPSRGRELLSYPTEEAESPLVDVAGKFGKLQLAVPRCVIVETGVGSHGWGAVFQQGSDLGG